MGKHERLGLTEEKADKMLMFLQMEDQFRVLNNALLPRKAALQLRFKTHYPELWIRTKNGTEELLARMDTRTKKITPMIPRNQDNFIVWNTIYEGLKNLGCDLVMDYARIPGQKKKVKLQIRSHSARRIRHTIWWVEHGENSPWMDSWDPNPV